MNGSGQQRSSMLALDALPADFFDDPFPYYRNLQRRQPVHRAADGSLLLSRYADVAQVYRDPGTFISDKRDLFRPKYGETPLFEHHTTSLVFNDPPYHSRVRRLIAGALKPAAVKAMAPTLARFVDGLLSWPLPQEFTCAWACRSPALRRGSRSANC
ncbi:MAG: hypothetical protein WD448_03965 [Woeseia sp.]